MQDSDHKGIVFNIQRFSVHDGDGIRTVVFLKGCPLRCRWCSNPESQQFRPERAFNPNRCLGASVCGRCVAACTAGSGMGGLTLTEDGLIRYDRAACTDCGDCVRRCPTGAQSYYGEEYSVAEIMKRVEEDDVFYTRSGGGLTLSGGEPLAQPDFTLALLREAKKARLHTTIESCGQYPTEALDQACRLLSSLIFDVKSLDPVRHREYTGHGNEQILKNLNHVFTHFPDLPVLVRTPVIPGFNDSEEEIMGIRGMLPDRPNVRYEVLTYHRLGMPKYGYIGRPWLMEGVVADEGFMKGLRDRLAAFTPGSALPVGGDAGAEG